MTEQRIGTTELLKIKRHARGFYLKVPKELVDCFGLKIGDVLRVEIKTVMRSSEEGG